MKPGKFVFLDRDGVINRDPHGYVTKWKNFRFIPNAKRAIRLLNANGFKIIVISNQGGISKGLFTKEKLDLITRNMLKSISNSGGRIHATWFCHHKLEDNCACKKPKIGLFKKATKNLKLNKKKKLFFPLCYSKVNYYYHYNRHYYPKPS